MIAVVMLYFKSKLFHWLIVVKVAVVVEMVVVVLVEVVVVVVAVVELRT